MAMIEEACRASRDLAESGPGKVGRAGSFCYPCVRNSLLDLKQRLRNGLERRRWKALRSWGPGPPRKHATRVFLTWPRNHPWPAKAFKSLAYESLVWMGVVHQAVLCAAGPSMQWKHG